MSKANCIGLIDANKDTTSNDTTVSLAAMDVSQAARRKKPLHRGTIPFWLYIVPTDLVSVFLYVGNL